MMNEMEQIDIKPIFLFWKNVLHYRNKRFETMVSGNNLREIISFEKNSKTNYEIKPAFCVFDIISDKYYRENFHRDIIAYLLDPTALHGYGYLGIKYFIKVLNLIKNDSVDFINYNHAQVIKEYSTVDGRIDTLIFDDTTKHAIIIENKMNRAVDMPRQIPRYCAYIKKEGYYIDAIVYLPLDKYSMPDKNTWQNEDYTWEDRVLILPAYADKGFTNLVDHWLLPMAETTITDDCKVIFRQYAYLVRILSIKYMDKITFDKFYSYLQQDDNLETANSLSSMMADLPKYLAQRIYDIFSSRCKPFKKMAIYAERDAVFEPVYIDGVYCKMDVWCDTRNYTILIWTPEEEAFSKKFNNMNFKEFLNSKGIHLFDDYHIDCQSKISNVIPITIYIEPIIDEIIKCFQQVAE